MTFDVAATAYDAFMGRYAWIQARAWAARGRA